MFPFVVITKIATKTARTNETIKHVLNKWLDGINNIFWRHFTESYQLSKIKETKPIYVCWTSETEKWFQKVMQDQQEKNITDFKY